jgi:hypothetical protein
MIVILINHFSGFYGIATNVLQICDGGLLTTELYAKHELKISVA